MIDETAVIDAGAIVSPTARVWGLVQIRELAVIEEFVVLGRGVYLGPGVSVGRNSKIQNFAMIYEPAKIGEGCFVGPGVILTNDRHPRAIDPEGLQLGPTQWRAEGVNVQCGASIGAGSVCVAPATIGRWAMVAAGSVVTRDVVDFALVGGTPAKRLGWVGHLGQRLRQGPRNGEWVCPESGREYQEHEGHLTPLLEVP